MEPKVIMDAWMWAVMHGVSGVLAVLVIVQTAVIRALYTKQEKLEAARLDDMRAFNVASGSLHDKVHRTVADINRVIDWVDRHKEEQ